MEYDNTVCCNPLKYVENRKYGENMTNVSWQMSSWHVSSQDSVCDKRHVQLKLPPATSKVQTDRVIVRDIPNSNNDGKVHPARNH
jgi:hypothetical protein